MKSARYFVHAHTAEKSFVCDFARPRRCQNGHRGSHRERIAVKIEK